MSRVSGASKRQYRADDGGPTMMELEERERRTEFIESLSPKERGIFADMIMRSLRGSWISPRKRAEILELISQSGEVEYYDAVVLGQQVEGYFKQIGRGSPDGRFWRTFYEEADIDVTELEESKVRELASHIPHDKTWDDWKINKEFGHNE